MATHAAILEHIDREVDTPTTYGRVAQAIGTSARAVGRAISTAPDTFRKGHLVLLSDWTINPGFRNGPHGPEDAARRLAKADFPVERLPDGRYRLIREPDGIP